MEYAYQDWTLAQMAKALNKISDHEMLQKRAANYRNIYDSSTGWMRARTLTVIGSNHLILWFTKKIIRIP